MSAYKDRIDATFHALRQTEYVLIGGGAGLSAAAGLDYSGKRFKDNFTDFIEMYGFEDMYSATFYRFKTEEERWAHWARHIWLNRYETPATELYKKLFWLVERKSYFVLTTNVESQFAKAGFEEDKIFATQGNYGLLQCARACHDKLYPNEAFVREMVEKTVHCRIPSALVPKCPVCGGNMEVNLRKDNYFVQYAEWYQASERYNRFLKSCNGKRIVFLELGVGFNTPGIIRYPFEQMTYQNQNAMLIRLNKFHPDGAKENAGKTIAFCEDMCAIIDSLLGANE
jgi:NAD-dependent SIR2 family protein deacetylase